MTPTLPDPARKPVSRLSRRSVVAILLALLAPPVASAQVQIAMESRAILARADSAYGAGDRESAHELYRTAAELDPKGSRSLYQLGMLEKNAAAATRWFLRYVALEPKDAWGWLALGKSYARQEKWNEATRALRRAASLAPDAPDIRQALAKFRRKSAPALRSEAGYSRDSDGNRVAQYRLAADAMLPTGIVVGATATRSSVGDGGTYSALLDEGRFRLGGRLRPNLRVDLTGGAARLADPVTEARLIGTGSVRLRWRETTSGPVIELGADRQALGATPESIASQVVRTEARLGVDLPIGPFRFRGSGRWGIVEALGDEANRRWQSDAALVLPLGWRIELSGQYHRLEYDHASGAGYSSPPLVETGEGAVYLQLGTGPITAELDLGAGGSRKANWNGEIGPWQAALRSYWAVVFPLTPSIEFRLDGEAYRTPFVTDGTMNPVGWSYTSANAGLRFRLP